MQGNDWYILSAPLPRAAGRSGLMSPRISRRQFLGTTSAAGVASLVAGQASAATARGRRCPAADALQRQRPDRARNRHGAAQEGHARLAAGRDCRDRRHRRSRSERRQRRLRRAAERGRRGRAGLLDHGRPVVRRRRGRGDQAHQVPVSCGAARDGAHVAHPDRRRWRADVSLSRTASRKRTCSPRRPARSGCAGRSR